MNSLSKQDVFAAGAILSMFAGALLLSISPLGLLLIGVGAIMMLLLTFKVVRTKQ